ncbi:MAG: substrate-binding domain-containing protein [Gammaproteobacteria bacterium]|nr:substrate-binding domain-containing protein [Gammaproteobacteria bacterium]
MRNTGIPSLKKTFETACFGLNWPNKLFVAVLLLILCASVHGGSAKYVVGFSQATTTEPWRLLFNKELRVEASRYPEIELLVRNGMDNISKQIADMDEFIDRQVDVILISPKVADALTPVVNKAVDRGIPVIVLDRDLNNDRYTQFIGGDNNMIGRAAGEYAVGLLGGTGKAKGNIVEIWGGMASTPARDRHDGFHRVIAREPGITSLLGPADGDWKQDIGYEIMAEALEAHPVIDLVYAHNDPMAFGAYLAAKDVGREEDILFLGIDAIPAEGIKWVNEGKLTATFVYQTPGAEGIRQALKLLNGESINPRITLPTQTIDAGNAEQILRDNRIVK